MIRIWYIYLSRNLTQGAFGYTEELYVQNGWKKVAHKGCDV